MHLARPTDSERVLKLCETTGRQAMQVRGRDQPARKASYGARPADKELKLRDATSRQGGQATGRRRPSKGRSYYLRQPVRRQFNVRDPRMQAPTFADQTLSPTTRTPAGNLAVSSALLLSSIAGIAIAHLGIGIDPACLAGTSIVATPRG